MNKNITYKILEKHLLEGVLFYNNEIKIKIDQTLTQDSTGTMVYLQLEAFEVEDKMTELSVAYIDHNTLQSSFENADDHEYIKSVALNHNIIYSKPGNGICHQLHLERFSIPGKTLIGSDSHTPTSGGMSVLAIGAGGLDVAVAIAKGYYYLKVPKVYNVILKNSLRKSVSAKDVILYILGKLSVKGGVGYVIEYSGEGVKSLNLTDRATICNMGAELGATTSIFPSDELTKDYLKRQGRAEEYIELKADEYAEYDELLEIDLSSIEPMVALPHAPDNISKVKNEKVLIDQVAIGSCTNSSYVDLMKVTNILKGKQVHPNVSLVISPGSSNVLRMLSDSGALGILIESGARILESSCGPCIGMGQAPKSGAKSVRTFNRNFKGRCGTDDAGVYLVSPETAAYSALTGYLSNPEELNESESIVLPELFSVNDNYFVYPNNIKTDVVRGPNIKPFPLGKKLSDKLVNTVLLKTVDDITTDDIMPSNAFLLPYRSNVPFLSKFAFKTICDNFKERSDKYGGGIVIAGENYGQGSSREHASLVPLHLNVTAIIAKSYARIHKANLINSGIIPFEFVSDDDYNIVDEYSLLEINNIREGLKEGKEILVNNKTNNKSFLVRFVGSTRDLETLLIGGTINYYKKEML